MTDQLTPGEQFAKAYANDPEHAEVTFDFTVTDAFKPSQDRPRRTVRNLFKKKMVDTQTTSLWFETRPTAQEAATVHESGLRREAAFKFGMQQSSIHPIQGWVQLPDELADDPDGLARFIDYRLLVRLATAENQALTLGEHGLLNHPGVAKLPYAGDYIRGVLAACNEIEQTGATAHAMIINPADYYFTMMVHSGLLENLARNGTLIVRTRMVAPGCALVGDFAVAAELLDLGRSVVKVAEPPAGTFATPGVAVCAEIYEGLAVHLPTHFFHAVPFTNP